MPIRSKPIQGEAVVGYLMRVADANGYESPRQLWHSLKSWENAVDALGLAECEIKHLFGCLPSYWGEQNTTKIGLCISDFNHYQLRWCPLCLMDSSHVRGVWLLKLSCVCTVHRIILHEKCPDCGGLQGLLRPKLDRCQCGTRLTSGNIDAASLNLINITYALELAISRQEKKSDLPGLTIQQWIKLASYLGQFTEKFQPAKSGQVANLHRLETATALMLGLANLLKDWPDNFHALLRGIHQQNYLPSLQKTFGSLYRVLYRQLKEPSYQFLRDAFEEYVERHWGGIICKRNKSFKPTTVNAHPQMTLKQAAKKAGTGVSVIRQLMDADLIEGNKFHSVSGRTSRTVNCHRIQGIITLTKGNVSLVEAAKILALPKRKVRLLIQAGKIKPIVSRKQVNASVWHIPKKELTKFLLHTCPIQPDFAIISMNHALKHWRLADDEFIALTEALCNKDMYVFSKTAQNTPMGKVYLSAQQFKQWLSALRYQQAKSMTVDGVARLLGYK